MANSQDVAGFYSSVIRSVIQEVRQDFINMGVDEQALFDLQASWEQKLLAAKVFNSVDYPYVASREYAPSGGFVHHREDYGHHPQMPFNNFGQPVRLQPQGYMPPYQMPPQGQQQPGQPGPMGGYRPGLQDPKQNPGPPGGHIPQYDGPGDDDGADKASPSLTATTTETQSTGEEPNGRPEAGAQAAVAPAIAEDELGSDLDDDDEEEDEEGDADDILLCLYEKVNRTRNKWRCNFKSGIVNIEGKDYAFSRLNGDFEW